MFKLEGGDLSEEVWTVTVTPSAKRPG